MPARKGPQSTDWGIILDLYDQLLALSPSSVVALNRAVAVGKVYGAAQALAAVCGHLLLELGRTEEAAACYRAALERRCSEPERRFLRRKLAECDSPRPEAGRGICP
jgi:RNA polymerase sigma-70 factor (ECF subfamily)